MATIAEEADELIERHRPLLRFDAQEPYLAIAAESIAVNPGNLLLRHDGTVLAAVDDAGSGLGLDLLARYPDRLVPDRRDRLDEAPDYLADARRLQGEAALAERAYGRAVRDGETLWLQYWLWLYYNPKHLLGFGRHEGDWELVQVGLDSDRRPRTVTYAQHDGGAARDWDQIERHPDDRGDHPVVYVAPFSHAAYFEARTHFYAGGVDSPDGEGPSYLPQIERFDDWALWPGRWGNSTGVLGKLGGGRLGGRSPAGPGAQTGRWERPGEFHARAARKRPFAGVGRALWSAGRLSYPRRPEIEATLTGTILALEYSLRSSLLRRPDRLHVTVHEGADERLPILLSSAVSVRGRRQGRIELRLPHEPERCLVRASTYNRLRQRSDPVEVVAERG